MRLDSDQQLRLAARFQDWLSSLELPIPQADTTETRYTGEVLLPRVQQWIRALGKDFLMVRGDGGAPPWPLIVDGMSFYPDIEVAAQTDRYLGVEVKLLRTAADATGSVSKALGQATIYRALGIQNVYVLLLDVRTGIPLQDSTVETFIAGILAEHLHVHWFAQSSGSMVQRFIPAPTSH